MLTGSSRSVSQGVRQSSALVSKFVPQLVRFHLVLGHVSILNQFFASFSSELLFVPLSSIICFHITDFVFAWGLGNGERGSHAS